MDDLKRRSTAIVSRGDADALKEAADRDGLLERETRLTRLKAQQIASG